MKRIPVEAAQAYEVLIERGIVARAGELTRTVHPPCKVAVLTDDVVEQLYGSAVVHSYEEAGYEASCFAFENGELSKTLGTFEKMLNYLADIGMTRSDLIVALGGGVVGDLAGFAAASYLRGMDFVQIPTTYLAAVDSSVGGKTGLNLNAGKNLCGAFYQPRLVLIDCDTFSTLPDERFADGIAETIKYGVIASKELFETMEQDLRIMPGVSKEQKTGNIPEASDERIEEIVAQCIQIKARFVAEDEFDNGTRMLLNFGHTFGHAIERCSNYGITHGYAVGMGMLMAARAAQKRGLCSEDCADRIANVLTRYGLPLSSGYRAEELAAAMLGDKKRRGNTLSLVLPSQIGLCRIHEIAVSELPALVASALEESR